MTARALARAVLVAAVAGIAGACADTPSPVAPIRSLSLGKSPAGPSVSAASPSYAHRDTTLDVHVYGSGFTTGAVAEWALAGVPNAAKIRTNRTQVASSSELIANITISADADLALWDVTVTVTGGKKGVGTELFEVTTATIIGGGSGIGGYVMGSSEQVGPGQVSVAGYGALSGAWVYDATSGAAVDLGAFQAWAIDATGTTALGRDGSSAAAWNRGANGVWTKEVLPSPRPDGNASSVATAADGSLIAGGWINVSVKRSQNLVAPVVWRRIAGVWQPPQTYALPGASGGIYAVSATGVAVGRAQLPDGSTHAVVWENPTTYTVLDGTTAYGVNAAGTIVVGDRNGAGYWYRTAGGSWMPTGTTLPSLGASCGGGRAQGVNDAGVIVGRSCVTTGKHLATVWRLDLSGTTPTLLGPPMSLGGLGAGADNTSGVAITAAAPYVVVGYVDSGSNITVRWLLP
jgi:hypothetical protein